MPPSPPMSDDSENDERTVYVNTALDLLYERELIPESRLPSNIYELTSTRSPIRVAAERMAAAAADGQYSSLSTASLNSVDGR